MNADIFDRTRAAVDEHLNRIAPEALEKFKSAYRRVHEGDPESLSQALASCRRILKAVADAVYPATGETVISLDENERTMSDDKYLNRILQAVSDALGKHGEAEVINATLKSLGERLKALDGLASKGVHAEVSQQEVDTCVIQTYLMVGDVLRIVSDKSGIFLAAEQPQS